MKRSALAVFAIITICFSACTSKEAEDPTPSSAPSVEVATPPEDQPPLSPFAATEAEENPRSIGSGLPGGLDSDSANAGDTTDMPVADSPDEPNNAEPDDNVFNSIGRVLRGSLVGGSDNEEDGSSSIFGSVGRALSKGLQEAASSDTSEPEDDTELDDDEP